MLVAFVGFISGAVFNRVISFICVVNWSYLHIWLTWTYTQDSV